MIQIGFVHLDEEVAEKYSLGTISDSEIPCIEEHLLICESCQHLVAQHDSFIAAIRAGAAQLRVEDEHAARRVIRLRVALAVVALVFVAVLGQNLTRKKPAPIAVALTVMRGTGVEVKAPSGVPLALQPDVTGLPSYPSYRLEMVDRSGKNVWKGAFPGGAVPSPAPGIYFIRIASPAGELLREYALEVTN
jgi:hypothetical protein